MTYTKFGSLFCGVEHTSKDGKEAINGLLLKKKKGEFLVEKTFISSAATDLKDQLPKSQHFYLIVNTDQVLSKTLNGVYNEQKAIAEAFPNLNSKDFYYEVYNTSTKSFIAISRKEYVDNLLNSYKKQEYNCIEFSLGNLAIAQLKDIVDVNNLQTSNSRINFVENEIDAINSVTVVSETEYNLNGLNLTNNSVLPLAGIISYYTQQSLTDSNFLELSTTLFSDFKQQRIFKVGLTLGLTLLFVSLMISFLLFSSYNKEINAISSELELNKTYKNSLLQLTDDVNKKERLVTDFSLSSSKVSWYLDQLGGKLPNSITLTELHYQPLQKSIKKEKQILLEENTILIKGESAINEDFSNWINILEKLDWIENVAIKHYGTDKKSTAAFEIELKLKV
ncbi:hypothetical protein [Aureibaculum luteum]|uniref:hypothetical protein n=1 Tax=Aureibaculum luteum TaxID=1548456 RepID=UPI0013004036|nr:hypothetical protein [Aureibaculum luteum]